MEHTTRVIGTTLLAETDPRDDFGWQVLDSILDATAVVDGAGVVVAVNATWERFRSLNHGDPTTCGVGADYLNTCASAAAAGCHDALVAYEGLQDVLRGSRRFFELEYPCPSPVEDRWFLQRITPLPGFGGAVVSHVDITRRKRAELELSQLASRDALTGLLNRRAIETGRVSGPAVLFIDLDDFKSVNDRLGHAVGDEVLARVANRIVQQIRPADRAVRLGGDEFLVILADTNGEETAAAVASRIERAVETSYQVGPEVVRVGASVGVAYGSPGEDIVDVVARADSAMYEVKRPRSRLHIR